VTEEGDRASGPPSGHPPPGPRVLRALVEELRASEAPPIAWDEMEASLMAKIDAAASVAPPAAEDERAEILVPWDDEPESAEEAFASAAPASARPRVAGSAVAKNTAELTSAVGSFGPEGTAPEGSPGRGASPVARPAAIVSASKRGRAAQMWGIAGLAVAAAAAWAVWPRVAPPVIADPVDLASVAVEPRLGDAFDLAGLRAGDVVEASEGPVTFGRAGVLRWTLSAGGRVRVVSGVGHEEPRHVVALESGALDVDVVPLEERRDDELAQTFERFVVEVGGARVAVHGTAFRVVRSSRGVVLDVVRGVVAVGPLAGGEGASQLVEGPARAAFGLDGSAFHPLPALAAGGVGKAPSSAPQREVVARNSDDERYAGVVEELGGGPPKAAPPAAPSVAPRAPEPVSEVTPPRSETVDARADQPWTADRVRSEVSACIARNGEKSGDGARVTIASSVVIDVDAAGSTRAVRFDPPIRPDLQACAQPVLRARFPEGTGRLLVPLEVRLGPAK
jgi:hypothetical protein